MGRIIYILTVVVAVLAILDVLRTPIETEKKILWIIIILILPVLGAIAWYLVSRKIINI